MDADDVSLPDRFAAQVQYLNAHPEVGVVGTASRIINSDGLGGQVVQYPESHDLLCWIMCFFENPIIHPSVMARKKIFKDVGGYNEACIRSQDYDLWSRIVSHTKLANMQEVCLHLRKHRESITQLHYQTQQEMSLQISAALISRILNMTVKPMQIQDYCDFLWKHRKMSDDKTLSAARIVFRLAKTFLSNTCMDPFDRLWIVKNAIDKLSRLDQELSPSPIIHMRLSYWKWSLKRLQ
jgi:hypothetical protein